MGPDALFYVAFATLIGHELDAVHKREWRLLFVLRNLPEPRARAAFVLAHVPLLAVLLWWLGHPQDSVRLTAVLALDFFMVVHAGLHWRLSTHPLYEFNTPVSRLLIYGAAVLGATHALWLAVG